MAAFRGMVALFTFLHRADVSGGEGAVVLQAVVGRAVQHLQALGVQVAHAPMPKVDVICWRHGHCSVR